MAVTDLAAPSSTVDGVVDGMLASSSKALRLPKIALNGPRSAHPRVDLLAPAVLFEDAGKSNP
ncbi:hypothetical protein [Mycolicibacterium moriokaense]|uniref:hypothetical protein n=1 Tax=Mycolicibacterium moriokaense TaxID=39691 RepID=UPI0010557DB8|nr:hypothetical protein [Mycolicibacterium moriokaense]MCV7037710.1 hypothetical protein [Mycolicibacterium moriokaense]